MTKSNYFSKKFEQKRSSELQAILEDSGYTEDAKLAAGWELEKRGENTSEYQSIEQKLAVDIETRTVQNKSDRRYRTFVPRFIAAILDGIFLIPVGLLLAFGSQWFSGVIGESLESFMPYVYAILLHGFFGQTVGKKAMGIKIIDKSETSDITLKQAVLRDIVPLFFVLIGIVSPYLAPSLANVVLAFIASTMWFVWVVVELVSMLFNEKSRAIHDLIAGTVVVRTA